MKVDKLFSDLLLDECGKKLQNLQIVDYILGLSYVAVETEAGVGLAYTFREAIKNGCNVTNEDLRRTPANKAAAMINSDDLLESAIGLATINSILNNTDYDESDILDNIDFQDKNVGMVGFFQPVVEKLTDAVANLHIFELKDIAGSFRPEYAKRILPQCDIVIISGTTFVNKTTEDFFHYIPASSKKVILGPSTPLSEKLSEYADLCSFKVTDKRACLDAIARGGGMRRLKTCGKKVALTSK
ncbi:MAG: hypothetical protein FXF49_01815 [Flexistipes sinusarabici]|uniref:Heavy-metal chelation domain-containing protein n=1 Tax=Flexistipes sinusarabici TaxID=2352 RepID=A0A5D0MSM7_FLESI|nr:DUF364 domain-containing protein [Flexistipes sinusarabici]TYB34898.1 MAG: hypothetical protein FXF49_01815 [Flexistipes sinusarabici]